MCVNNLLRDSGTEPVTSSSSLVQHPTDGDCAITPLWCRSPTSIKQPPYTADTQSRFDDDATLCHFPVTVLHSSSVPSRPNPRLREGARASYVCGQIRHCGSQAPIRNNLTGRQACTATGPISARSARMRERLRRALSDGSTVARNSPQKDFDVVCCRRVCNPLFFPSRN